MPKLITINIIAWHDRIGAGKDGNPYRLSEEYCFTDGKWIASYDSYKKKTTISPEFLDDLRNLAEKHDI